MNDHLHAHQHAHAEADTAKPYTDPVCGMQVHKANAPAHIAEDGIDVWFCSDRCRERYERDPDRHRPRMT